MQGGEAMSGAFHRLTVYVIVDHSGKPDPAALNSRGMPRLFETANQAVRFCYAQRLDETSHPEMATLEFLKKNQG